MKLETDILVVLRTKYPNSGTIDSGSRLGYRHHGPDGVRLEKKVNAQTTGTGRLQGHAAPPQFTVS